MNHVFYVIPLLLVISIPTAFAQSDLGIFEKHTTIQNEDGTYTTSTHYPYLEDFDGSFVPYRIVEESDFIQVEFNGGKIVFDKNSGASTIFQNGTSVINSDSYMVRNAELNSDVWSFLDVNDSPVTVNAIENDDNVIVTVTRQNNEGIFEIEHIINSQIKTTAKFTNLIYNNHKFAFTQTINLNDNIIELNDQTINLNDYIGQTFPREVLEQNQDLIIEAKELFYNSGLGFENLWSVGIFDDNRIALDYANVNQTQTAIGQTVELDPTWTDSSTGRTLWVHASTLHSTISSPGQSWYSYHQGSTGYSVGAEYDTSAIPTSAIVSAAAFTSASTAYSGGGSGCELVSLSNSPTFYVNANSWSGLEGAVNSGSAYTSGTSFCLTGYWTDNFNSNAISDFQSAISAGTNVYWGFRLNSPSGTAGYYNAQGATDVFTITYSLPVPDPPTNGHIDPQQHANQLIIDWDAPASGTAPDGYKIDKSVSGGAYTTLEPDSGNTITNITDGPGLLPNTNYSYRIWSLIGATPSTTYATASGTTWNVPDQVTGLTGTSGTNPSLSWGIPNSDATLTNYKIYRGGVLHDTISASSATYSDSTNIVSGSTYSYSVSAVSGVGEGSQSSSINLVVGTPPGVPTGLTSTIQDANNSPLDVFLQWSTPSSVGSGTLTGFEIYRNGVLITTTGLVNSYTDTVSQGSHSHYVKAVSTHGTSGNSNTVNITTPNVPSAINDLSGSVISDTQINLSWSAPNDGGSNIDLYKVFKDGSQVDTTTNVSYSATGLTPNTSYAFVIVSNNSVGDSANSNSITKTTYQSVSGSITVTPTTQGATTELVITPTGISGTPTPNFNIFTIKEGSTVLAQSVTSPYYLFHNDDDSHTYTVTSTDSSHWNTPTITGSAAATSDYTPSWNTNNVSYNYTRSSGVMDLTVNQNLQTLWDATCNYKTTTEVLNDQSGIQSNHTGVWYISESQNISDIDTVYVSCNDDGTKLFSFTSFGPNRLGGGIAQLDDVFGDMTGTPVALIFVLLVAGLFTGRSAPTGILLVLALIGVLGFIGMLTIDEAVWGFLLLAGVLGIFLGKRFL
jgi:hypothetical protein